MARRRDRRAAEEVTPGARIMGGYALALEGDGSQADLGALSDADLARELRRLLAEDRATPGARAALKALEARQGVPRPSHVALAKRHTVL